MRATLSILVILSVLVLNASAFSGCYKNTTDRGVGKVIDSCPKGQEKQGLLCYPECKSGFTGVGPVCWQACPEGFVDTGAFCNPREYSGDDSGCPWYDLCGLTLAKGCVKCQPGDESEGCLCKHPGNVFPKQSYDRGDGTPLVCAPGLVLDADGLCYPPCPSSHYQGEGPVCWQDCPPGNFTCGAFCLNNENDCSQKVEAISSEVLQLVAQIAACSTGACDPTKLIQELIAILASLGLNVCPPL